DGAGHSHVASAGEAGTYHFTDASGAFVADLVSTSALAGPSISVRGVVVAVFGEASGQMRYAQGPAPWTDELVQETAEAGQDLSFVLDGAGAPHVAHRRRVGTQRQVACAKKTGAAWTSEIVDASADDSSETSLALDVAGHAHLSYGRATNSADSSGRELRYATNASGAWTTEV